MRFNVISYLIGEGLSNIFKNKKSTMSSLMIMCATMFIFGLFFVIGENINAFVKTVADAQGIKVFIENTATDAEIEEIGNEIILFLCFVKFFSDKIVILLTLKSDILLKTGLFDTKEE